MAQPLSMIIKKKKKNAALKPKDKSLKARVRRIKADMGRISEDQRRIREVQRNIRERLGEVKSQCDELRLETEAIAKQSAFNRIRLVVMLNILRARQNGEFAKAAALTRFLKLVSDRRKL